MKIASVGRDDFSLVDLERLNAFKSAIVRCRWFLLVTTFVSCLVLVNAYLQEFSAHESALKETLKRRYQSAIGREQPPATQNTAPTAPPKSALLGLDSNYPVDDIFAELSTALRAKGANEEEILDEFAEIVLSRIATQNSLRVIRHGERPLPLLGLDIPAYDFLPIMSGMIIVFFLGTWLNVRSLTAIFDFYPLRDNRILLELIMLNFTFTGIWGSKRDRNAAQAVQTVSFCLPTAAIVAAIFIDSIPIFKIIMHRWDSGTIPPLEAVVGPLGMVFGRILFELFAAAIVLGISVSSIAKVNAIDSHIQSIIGAEESDSGGDAGQSLDEHAATLNSEEPAAEPELPEHGENTTSEA